MDDYNEFIQERTGNLTCFHIYSGETNFRLKDMAHLEEPSFEDRLIHLDKYRELSEKATIAVEALFNNEEAVKFYSYFGKKFRNYSAMNKLMECWKRDRPQSLRKGLRIYLRRHKGFSIREVNEVFSELREFVANL
jgi:hypothetical protein